VLSLSGQIFDGTNCKTPAGFVTLDIWHANPDGIYSEGRSKHSTDFMCRALISTDANGKFSFNTLMPGRYDNDGFRPGHVHFKIYPPAPFVSFTTQLYFNHDIYIYPNDSCTECNSKDKTLVVNLEHLSDIKTYVGVWNIFLAKQNATDDSNADGQPQKKKEDSETIAMKVAKKNPYSKKEPHIQPGAFRKPVETNSSNVKRDLTKNVFGSYAIVAVACLAVGGMVGMIIMRTISKRANRVPSPAASL
jgi:protocatechuate 3,4-dioxygenase beta subunit